MVHILSVSVYYGDTLHSRNRASTALQDEDGLIWALRFMSEFAYLIKMRNHFVKLFLCYCEKTNLLINIADTWIFCVTEAEFRSRRFWMESESDS